MNKLQYLDALKAAMHGLAPAVQAKTLAYYEQRFVDGVAAGRSEAAVAAELDDPRKIAMTLRASAHMASFEQQRNPANFLRMVVAGLGLAIFNLLMVVPAAVYLSLLAALYAVALGGYVIGIAITASGLAGANELVLNHPFGVTPAYHNAADRQIHVSISESGIRVFDDKQPSSGKQAAAEKAAEQAAEQAVQAARDAIRARQQALAASRAAASAEGQAEEAEALAEAANELDKEVRPSAVIRRAEAVAGRAIRITTDVDAASRTTQTAFGLVMVVGAILLFLLGMVIGKYTALGLKRYFQMNLALLKGS